MSDCLWGLLDGINDAGLAVSLTFGGRRDVGDGFAIPLVVRYLLETCDTVAEAREALERIPVHAPQNLTLLDRSGAFLTAYVGPGRAARVPRGRRPPRTTRARSSGRSTRAAIRTVEREECVLDLLADPEHDARAVHRRVPRAAAAQHRVRAGFGTLYTAAYHPAEGRAEYRWPGFTWEQSLDASRRAADARIPSSNAAKD